MRRQPHCTAFQAVLQNGDLNALRRIPKSDLHNHFFLGGNRALVRAWAGHDIAPLDRPLASMAEMHTWVDARFGKLFGGAHGRLNAAELDEYRLNGWSDDRLPDGAEK